MKRDTAEKKLETTAQYNARCDKEARDGFAAYRRWKKENYFFKPLGNEGHVWMQAWTTAMGYRDKARRYLRAKKKAVNKCVCGHAKEAHLIRGRLGFCSYLSRWDGLGCLCVKYRKKQSKAKH